MSFSKLCTFLAALFFILLVRTAWLSDDSYIIFRTVDNFVHGLGLRWNTVERVQTFTAPLWTLLIAGFYAVTREVYVTSLALSAAVSIAAFWLMIRKIALSTFGAILAAVALLVSKAFVDFSTSGLENPLTHLLLATFLAVYFQSELNLKALGTLSAIAFGSLPFVTWEIFSTIYYGFPFPNTAYAKLGSGIPAFSLARQGLLYLGQSLRMDPVTLMVTAAGVLAPFFIPSLTKNERAKIISAGILLYLIYVIRVGGDFMSGRFLAAPFFAAAAILSRLPPPSQLNLQIATFAPLLFLGVFTATSPLRSGPDYGRGKADLIDPNGICDERAFYFPAAGLRNRKSFPKPDHDWLNEGRRLALRGDRVVVRHTIGFFGFAAGPAMHVIDDLALADPLLARLPLAGTRFVAGKPVISRTWRIGHFNRDIPEGYLNTLVSGKNTIVDPHLASYYDKLSLIIRGPLFDPERLKEIVRMNLGRHDSLIDEFLAGQALRSTP